MLSAIQRLKLRLMTEGIGVTGRAATRLAGEDRRPLTLADYASTSGISLRLEDDVWVNAPLQPHNPNFVSDPTMELDLDGGTFVLREGSEVFRVEPIRVPSYSLKKNSSEELHSSYAVTHTDRVRLSPIEGCSMVCSFCDLPYRKKYRRRQIDGLLEAAEAALADEVVPARHILLSGGTPKPEDYAYLNTVYEVFGQRFSTVSSVDVMMVPLPGLLDVDRLLAAGIHGLSINIELFNSETARKIMPQKQRLGTKHYLDFIEQAVERFGPGRVRSLILVGIEPLEDTLRGVAALAERGCEPVLSPFRPDPATPLKRLPPPEPALLERAYLASREIVDRMDGVKLGPRCIPCQHNTLTFPDGSSAYYYS